MKVVVCLALVFLSSAKAIADCKDESKDLDSCLQCCTDTSQAAEFIGKDYRAAAALAEACKKDHKVDPKILKDLYAKYRIDGSIYFTACANPNFVQGGQFSAEPYDACVKACEEKFKQKKKASKKQ